MKALREEVNEERVGEPLRLLLQESNSLMEEDPSSKGSCGEDEFWPDWDKMLGRLLDKLDTEAVEKKTSVWLSAARLGLDEYLSATASKEQTCDMKASFHHDKTLYCVKTAL